MIKIGQIYRRLTPRINYGSYVVITGINDISSSSISFSYIEGNTVHPSWDITVGFEHNFELVDDPLCIKCNQARPKILYPDRITPGMLCWTCT